jgi:hypothetical protein
LKTLFYPALSGLGGSMVDVTQGVALGYRIAAFQAYTR